MNGPNTETLIVGAGPTGLTAAIEMARQGVPFRLVERSPHPAEHSQALLLQARTLEQFERYGIADSAVEQGRKLHRASFISEGKRVFSLDLDSIPGRYPFVLFLPQSQTEALLIDHLSRLGGRVERGVELLQLAEGEDCVEVQLRDASGRVECCAAHWVIGCDGAHSRVRESLEIPFTGESVEMDFFLGDLVLEGPDLPGDELAIHLHHGDIVFLGRLTERLVRVIVALHSNQGKQPEKKLELSDFQQPIDRAGIRLRAVGAEWMTPFRVQDRRAEKIHHGRVFLAGDAAHIHSPVGGQGMNTGIQDAANLAWKLAAVAAGAESSLLDSYDVERGAVSEALLKETSQALEAAAASQPWVGKIRDLLLSAAVRLPALRLPTVQQQLLDFVSETGISYRHSPVVVDAGGQGSIHAGDRMPNPEIVWKQSRMYLLEPMRIARPLAICFDVKDRQPIEQLMAHGGEVMFLEANDLQQGRQELTEIMGGDDRLVVVRPDGYVGFRGSATDLEHLERYARLTGLTGRREPHAGPIWAA
jgi:2-polyprenyl-6-methoxyphenol hydroxylase-like FAD-dependent oxidoreductase